MVSLSQQLQVLFPIETMNHLDSSAMSRSKVEATVFTATYLQAKYEEVDLSEFDFNRFGEAELPSKKRSSLVFEVLAKKRDEDKTRMTALVFMCRGSDDKSWKVVAHTRFLVHPIQVAHLHGPAKFPHELFEHEEVFSTFRSLFD